MNEDGYNLEQVYLYKNMILSFLIQTLFLNNYFLTFWKGRIFSKACGQQKLEEYWFLITWFNRNTGLKRLEKAREEFRFLVTHGLTKRNLFIGRTKYLTHWQANRVNLPGILQSLSLCGKVGSKTWPKYRHKYLR